MRSSASRRAPNASVDDLAVGGVGEVVALADGEVRITCGASPAPSIDSGARPLAPA